MTVENCAIKVSYDGVGSHIKLHQMKASSVARSIGALEAIYTEAYRESNRVLKSNVQPNVLIEGGFKEGSLWWLIKIFTDSSEYQTNIDKNVSFKFVSRALKKVIGIIKSLPKDDAQIVIREVENGYKVEIDGDAVILDEVECAILTNEKIRKGLSDLVSPLSNEEISTLDLEYIDNPDLSVKIGEDSKSAFLIKRSYTHIVDEGSAQGFFYVDTLSYNPKSKWKVVSSVDPKFSFSALITDTEFLKRISDDAEKFSKNDLLEIEYSWFKEKVKLTGKVKSSYLITKVKDHISEGERQWKLV
ncbi:hypothetical protein [Marinomonas gallaica]|uniref:hypothetical protein n=1 Tax=Marinomonas gallaica TaxID=1806667 RepID=UPI003A95319C